ncbi:MAG: hypothetical protein PHO37_03785 [Kiritimatiellae bacterium]|nr:hypothetical protein [Kiritimatiellia bacterium]
MQMAFNRYFLAISASLLLLGLISARAQIDILTPVNQNSVQRNPGEIDNPATLGPGSGLHAPNLNATGTAHFQTTLGQGVALQASDTFLGQTITPPVGANPNIAPTVATSPGSGSAVWLDYAQILIASGIGVIEVEWTLAAGGTVTTFHTVSFSPVKRPVRLYWTHQRPSDTSSDILPLQNAGPTIHFSNNYRVDIFGNTAIGVYNKASGFVGDVRMTGTELQAFSGANGHFLLVYSRWDELTAKREFIAHEIVNVMEPMSTRIEVAIGGRLLPVTRQTEQLFPMVTRGMTDETGGGEIYVYQHSAGLQRDWLWAIRDTTDKPWKIEVYWQAREELDVLWPFEVDIYKATWHPDRTQLFARHPSGVGNGALPEPKVLFPSTLSVAAMPYQVPANHMIVENGAFYSTIGGDSASGFSLIKFTSGDLVWFQPFHSVHNNNTLYFTLPVEGSEQPVTVAEEIVPAFASQPDGSTGFFYPGWMRAQDPDAPAAPVRNPYNINTYNYPATYTPTNALDSIIFAVNEGLLNITWSTPCRLNNPPSADDSYIQPLPNPIFIPAFPARYRASFPQAGNGWNDLPMQIVLASGKGSTGGSINDFAECVAGPGVSVPQAPLSAGLQVPLFNGARNCGNVTIEAWLAGMNNFTLAQFSRPSPDGTATNLLFSVGVDDGYLKINNSKLTDLPRFPNDYPSFYNSNHSRVWQHIALSWDVNSNSVFFINGQLAGTFVTPFPSVNFTGDIVTWFAGFSGAFHGVRLWSSTRSWQEIRDHRYLEIPKPNEHLIAEYDEVPVWNPVTQSYDYRYENWITDNSGNDHHLPFIAGGMSRSPTMSYAFPRRVPGMVFSTVDLYRQPDRNLDGYNPNEEHALIVNGIAYALRADLNQNDADDPDAYTSEPFVLVEYRDADTGRRCMKAFQVVPENDMYRFSSFMEAGQMSRPRIPSPGCSPPTGTPSSTAPHCRATPPVSATVKIGSGPTRPAMTAAMLTMSSTSPIPTSPSSTSPGWPCRPRRAPAPHGFRTTSDAALAGQYALLRIPPALRPTPPPRRSTIPSMRCGRATHPSSLSATP